MMRLRLGIAATLGLMALLAPAAATSTASAAPARPALIVSGTVSDLATYTLAQLRVLPAETVTVPGPIPGWGGSRNVRVTGVSLDSLVTLASPVLPAVKNALLRVTVTARGPSGQRVTFALGELDANFGDHDAVLVLSVNGHPLPAGPALAVPGDRGPFRDLRTVNQINVGVASPSVVTPPAPGAVVVESGPRQEVLSAQTLARLPAATLTVSFLAGTSSQTHTESGPSLSEVLRAARFRAGPGTWVAAVGSDGYVAVVTPGEAWFGGRPLLLSLSEDGAPLSAPRLVADGDVKGGRYVSGVVALVIGHAAP